MDQDFPEAAHLDSEHEPDMIETHFCDELLKSEPTFGGPAAWSLILVDHQNPSRWPTILLGPFGQPILQLRRLAMFLDLPLTRLSNVNHRQSLTMVFVDFSVGFVLRDIPLFRGSARIPSSLVITHLHFRRRCRESFRDHPHQNSKNSLSLIKSSRSKSVQDSRSLLMQSP